LGLTLERVGLTPRNGVQVFQYVLYLEMTGIKNKCQIRNTLCNQKHFELSKIWLNYILETSVFVFLCVPEKTWLPQINWLKCLIGKESRQVSVSLRYKRYRDIFLLLLLQKGVAISLYFPSSEHNLHCLHFIDVVCVSVLPQ
jgi:hypothetical protein